MTASALVIGLALVGLTATFGESAKASVRQATASGLRADFVVKAGGFASFSSDVAARLVDVPSVTDVVSMRFADAQVGGDSRPSAPRSLAARPGGCARIRERGE